MTAKDSPEIPDNKDESNVEVEEVAGGLEKIDIKKLKGIPGPNIPPLTKIGFWLAIIVFGYISIVTGILLTDYIRNSPQIPVISAADTTGVLLSAVENYERLSEIATNRSLKLFDQLIHKTILPVLTAILGYIFGIRGVEKRE